MSNENLEKIEVKTPFGTIIASKSNDSMYPGIWVEFKPEGSEYARNVALIECDKNENNEDGSIRAIVWGDKGMIDDSADYTDKFIIFNDKDKEV